VIEEWSGRRKKKGGLQLKYYARLSATYRWDLRVMTPSRKYFMS